MSEMASDWWHGEVAKCRRSTPATSSTSSRGKEHWHGATPDGFMTHIAMHDADESGQAVTWEHVTDEEYEQV